MYAYDAWEWARKSFKILFNIFWFVFKKVDVLWLCYTVSGFIRQTMKNKNLWFNGWKMNQDISFIILNEISYMTL
jgi:hypothetical protein